MLIALPLHQVAQSGRLPTRHRHLRWCNVISFCRWFILWKTDPRERSHCYTCSSLSPTATSFRVGTPHRQTCHLLASSRVLVLDTRHHPASHRIEYLVLDPDCSNRAIDIMEGQCSWYSQSTIDYVWQARAEQRCPHLRARVRVFAVPFLPADSRETNKWHLTVLRACCSTSHVLHPGRVAKIRCGLPSVAATL